jgi:hypothetical protein
MIVESPRARAEAALLTLQRTRVEFQALMRPPEVATFPRSVTFRWLLNGSTGRWVAATVISAALSRVPAGRLLAQWLFRRR